MKTPSPSPDRTTSALWPWWCAPATAGLIVSALGAFGLASLWPQLHSAWTNVYGAFSHGYLVLLMCVWMGSVYWRQSPPGVLKPSRAGFVLLIGSTLAVALMGALYLNSSRLVLLPVIAISVVAAVFGMECARRLFWPVAFMYAALPQWWIINGALQSLTTGVVGTAVRLTGLPAYVEGNFIHVPAGLFEVASGCSGLSYLIAAISLSGFQALVQLQLWRNRALLVGAAAALALIANWIRVYALIVIGIASDMQHYLIRVDHLYFGWGIFIVLLVPVFFLAARLSRKESQDLRPDGPVAAAPPVIYQTVVLAAIASGVILLVPRLLELSQFGPDPAFQSGRQYIDQLADAGLLTNAQPSEWKPAFVGAHNVHGVLDGQDSVPIKVFVAFYRNLTSEQQLFRPENDFFGSSWRHVGDAQLRAMSGVIPLNVRESHGHLAGREALIWSWYNVAGRSATSQLGAKLLEAWGLLRGRRDAAAIALSTPCIPDCTAARARLHEFTRESGPLLQAPD